MYTVQIKPPHKKSGISGKKKDQEDKKTAKIPNEQKHKAT